MQPARKYSKKREAILTALQSTKTHPNAEWIYSKLKPDIPDLSLGTVYRNLAIFKSEGTIMSVATVDGQERFDGNSEPHTHFICDCCGTILDIDDLSQDESLDRIAERLTESEIRCHSLVFHGRCCVCKNKNFN